MNKFFMRFVKLLSLGIQPLLIAPIAREVPSDGRDERRPYSQAKRYFFSYVQEKSVFVYLGR